MVHDIYLEQFYELTVRNVCMIAIVMLNKMLEFEEQTTHANFENIKFL